MSTDFLDRVFARFFDRIGVPNLMPKSNYHVLASIVGRDRMDAEIVEKLDAIVATVAKARPTAAPESP